MCGIVGVVNLREGLPVEEEALRAMLETIRHRGPDGLGIYRDPSAGLGSARLSVIDLESGDQPIGNEDGSLWMVFNGEIYNYLELRAGLEARGHRFTTRSDTEVILHLYEDLGPACLEQLNGQFAIAIWDAARQRLFLARDRLGVRPLFYTVSEGRLIFGSEIKAIFACPGTQREIDLKGLEQVFTYWSTLAPQTIFRGIHELPAGHYLLCMQGNLRVLPYWSLEFDPEPDESRSVGEDLEEFEGLMVDAVRLRLRADVPVGAYLSGGLDSSITAALIRKHTHTPLDTFSIAFADPSFDESPYQRRMAEYLETNHQVVYCTSEEIGQVFPEVIWHAETPILRTAPAPMYLLSNLVRQHGLKVVVTGEGADELLGGYDIFKEAAIRRFWARDPESKFRPLLLKQLYPDIPRIGQAGWAYRTQFFKRDLTAADSPLYSHILRWGNAARLQRFLAAPPEPAAADHPGLAPFPRGFDRWPPLSRAQYLEITTFLTPYLLSSQGDRMAMGHSVEGRYPFLDPRVVEFCNRLPPDRKLYGLQEKRLLRLLGRKYLPEEIRTRRKRPYRAPIRRCFFHPGAPEYVQELLSEEALRQAGIFDPGAVAQLKRKAGAEADLSELDEMALVGVLSAQLVYHQFVKQFKPASAARKPGEQIKIIDRVNREAEYGWTYR